jgi:hypothetical protein
MNTPPQSKAIVASAVVAMVAALVHCSSSGHASGSGVAAVHRASAATCTAPRAPSVTHDGGFNPNNPYATCHADAECTQGKNGRCQGVFNSAACACNYDECNADADCASGGACVCRTTNSIAGNYCATKGNCLTDTDCGSGYCSPSRVGDTCNAASIAYYCHTSDDECTNDSDCSAPALCLVPAGQSHWQCTPYPACDGGVQPTCE